jgi:hypothetical protein
MENELNEINEQQPWTARLSPWELELTREKIAKINARAEKRGFTGRFEVTAEKRIEKALNTIGMVVEKVWYETQIAGTAPCYNGWRFLARIDVLPDGETFTLAVAPGAGEVDRAVVKIDVCEHCDKRRRRKNIYLVENEETGEIRNVGSSCIKDFIGHNTTFCFVDTGAVGGELDEFFGSSGQRREESFTVATVLAAAWLATKAWGWVGAKGDGRTTRQNTLAVIDPPRKQKSETWTEREYRETCEALGNDLAEAVERVPEMIAWVESLDNSTTFNENLKVAVGAGEVGPKQIGTLAYVPEGFARSQRKAAEREAVKVAGAASEFIGEIGEKVEVEGTIKAINYIEGQYGTTVLYTIVAEAGLVKWFASSAALGDNTGIAIKIKGTVKKHDTFREVKSTVLTRCREI